MRGLVQARPFVSKVIVFQRDRVVVVVGQKKKSCRCRRDPYPRRTGSVVRSRCRLAVSTKLNEILRLQSV